MTGLALPHTARTDHALRGKKDADEDADMPGFCNSATLEQISKHSHVPTLGRYVGAEGQEDDGVPGEDPAAHRHARPADGRDPQARRCHRGQPEELEYGG